jgi:hypothetical protein
MSRAEDLVIAYLDLLHRHKKSVARAYHSGSLIADEEVSARAINDLRNQLTLVPLAPDTFRLASSLTRHFDEILQKEQLFAIVGSNIAELTERLTFLVDETVEAHVAGRTEALDGYADDFANSVCDLGAQIAQALAHLRMLADTRFASVRTLAEKVRQNTWYIGRAERIGNVLKTLQAGGLIERIEEEAAAAALLPAFRTQLWDRLPEWRESLLDITEILKAYLYRLRQVQPEGRRLRAFHLFLRRNPDYTLPDLSELTEIPEWARGADPLPIAAHPDYQDATTADPLAQVAATVPRSPTLVTRPPKVGTLKVDEVPQRVFILQPRLYQVALRRLMESLPDTDAPVSALGWKRSHPEYTTLPDSIWLHCVLHESAVIRRRSQHVRFAVIQEPLPHLLAGNIVVRDVVLCRVTGDSGP